MGSDVGLKVDGAVSSQLANAAQAASKLEGRGYDCCWTAEINHDPFLPLVLAAEHTTRIELGTSIAVAFARNPMTVANIGWDLQAYSDGRFILGLGSQVQPHIEKRFSMPWGQPVRRMREFVLALREIWACWRDGTKLRFEGDFYTHKLMTPMFTPEPQPHPFPKVFVAAVGEAMTDVRRGRRRLARARVHHQAVLRRGDDAGITARHAALWSAAKRISVVRADLRGDRQR
jgi:alkanesulfonate monooxygenase SsuD/methylene tetrahydromethanopterin reductase-like flavin-dependent oxidoreductase (luciferase family)